jgi:hypothetical protein
MLIFYNVRVVQSFLSGVNVMVTIFCGFYQFSAKKSATLEKLAFSSKTNVISTLSIYLNAKFQFFLAAFVQSRYVKH